VVLGFSARRKQSWFAAVGLDIACGFAAAAVPRTKPQATSSPAAANHTSVNGPFTDVTYRFDAGVPNFPRGTQTFAIVLAKRAVRGSYGNDVPGGTIGSFRMKLR
jgi:hypothetical protein